MGNLEGLSAILGCPLLMPHIDLLHKGALLGLSPEQQGLVCSALLLAANWVRELLNAWGHHVLPQWYAHQSQQRELYPLAIAPHVQPGVYIHKHSMHALHHMLPLCA